MEHMEQQVQTRRMKENFGFFGPVTFLYSVFYAFCMFRNGSGITFPFFVAASLFYLYFTLSKLEITLKKGSTFHMVSMMLLAISTFCTDDGRIIAFNKTGIFLLAMSFLLQQFYDTGKWTLGKYLGSIWKTGLAAVGELSQPFIDAAGYFKQSKSKKNKTFWYVLIGAVIAIPLVAFVIIMLSLADVVFRQVAGRMFAGMNFDNIIPILFRVGFLFLASYCLISFLCKRTLSEEVVDKRRGEPILAITVNGMLTVVYLFFSLIQIVYLFMGKMELPEGYTYAMYAREGFFQLLVVSVLNLILVLMSLRCFRENKVLKAILTVMSLCTFIMITSSAMRMIIYIHFYNLTFLRILVLWALALLFVLFVGVILNIFKKDFPLFGYGMVVVTVMYLLLSFSHPDYLIAKINLANAEEGYLDYEYLSNLCADAAPVLIPYLEELGYDLEAFYILDEEVDARGMSEEEEVQARALTERNINVRLNRDYLCAHCQSDFGYYYLRNLQEVTENFGLRTYNVSRHVALQQIEEAVK